MLARMGYKPGKGLGARDQGIVDPVASAKVLPAGTGLDFVSDPSKAGKRRKRKTIAEFDAKTGSVIVKREGDDERAERKAKRKTVFDFLNRSIGDRKRARHDHDGNGNGDLRSGSGSASQTQSKGKPLKESEARSKLLALKESVTVAEQEVKREEQSLQRNVGKANESIFRQRVAEAHKKVSSLQQQITLLQNTLKGKQTTKQSLKFWEVVFFEFLCSIFVKMWFWVWLYQCFDSVFVLRIISSPNSAIELVDRKSQHVRSQIVLLERISKILA